MLEAETKRRIDTARDILVGKVPDPKSQVEQITIALIYKFMDDMDKESISMGGNPSFFVGEYEKYSWTKIFNPRLGGYEMLSLYSEAITRLSQNPNLPSLFRDIFKNAYLPYRDPATLKLFLKTINEFVYDHSERLGDAYEYLLAVLGSQGDAGQFLTPRHIINFMVQVVNPKKDEVILDPACGTAGFLISAYRHILQTNTDKAPGDLFTIDERKRLANNIKGYDIAPDMVRLSLVNMYLHGFTNPQISEYDTLTSEDKWGEYADVILANPPFMTPKGGIKPHKRFSVQSNRSEVLFVDYIAEHLTPNGRAAVIVPEGVTTRPQKAYVKLRESLVNKYIWAVVSLPSGVFKPYSGVKTSILFLDKQMARKSDRIVFIRVENDGFDLGDQRKPIEKNDLPSALIELVKYSEVVHSGKPNYSSAESRGVDFIQVDRGILANGGMFNLSADKYREKNQTRSNDWELVQLKDICEVIAGQSPEGQFYNKEGLGTPFYQGKTEFGEIWLGPAKVWTTVETKIAEKDDVVMSVRAPVGPVNMCKERVCIGRGLAALRARENCIPKYLFWVLKLSEGEIKGSVGSTFSSINKSEIENISIPLPPISTQREIVGKIEEYQEMIRSAHQVIDVYKKKIETLVPKLW